MKSKVLGRKANLRPFVKNVVLSVLSGSILVGLVGACSSTAQDEDHRLVTGRSIVTNWQSIQGVGSMPMNMILSSDGKYALTSDIGYYQSLWAIKTNDGKGASHIGFPNQQGGPSTLTFMGGSVGEVKTNGLYYGLAISRDGVLYAAQGAHDSVAILKLDDSGQLSTVGSIKVKHQDFPAGVALDDRGLLYVANNSSGENLNPFKMTGSVAIYDTKTKQEVGRYKFAQSYGGTSNFPYGIAALRDGSKCYVASERDDAVYALDTHDAAQPKLIAKLETGAHPVAVLLNRNQSKLYVANSLGDTISVIDTDDDKIDATILLRPKFAHDLPGITPTALALSPDEKTLYAALSDMNAVAVIDARNNELRGYIPAGWYPTGVAVSADGRDLLISNAKGTTARNPNNHPDPHIPHSKETHSNQLLEGNVVSVRMPSEKELERCTQQVMHDSRLELLDRPQTNPLADIGLAAGKIKHVIYVVKENRTYDQILSDLPQGNGDKSLLLFGRDVTPNQHAMAERFVLLDNLYACGEVSGDGWDWSTQGMADAYVQRNVPYNYSHRGRIYDQEGQNNAYPTSGAGPVDNNGKPWTNSAFKGGVPAIPDVANTGRNIWDAAKDAGISYRNWGMFVSFDGHPAGVAGAPHDQPAAVGLTPGGHDLEGVTDVDFRRFDLDYADSDAPMMFFKETGDKRFLYQRETFGKYNAPNRFFEWNREFQMMLKKDPTGAGVPALMLVRLPENHTKGASGGAHSPRSYVADNDYGLGQLVEMISNSPIWKDTAIFVIEDDAQSGVDHVDAHRTIAYIISPWIKAHSVDHHFYNTDSMLKTMELLLGLHPLCQFDAVADPIVAPFAKSPENDPKYQAILPAKELFAELNPQPSTLKKDDPRRKMALQSQAMDFTHADAAPARELDEIVWHTVKGPNTPMPVGHGLKDDDDD